MRKPDINFNLEIPVGIPAVDSRSLLAQIVNRLTQSIVGFHSAET